MPLNEDQTAVGLIELYAFQIGKRDKLKGLKPDPISGVKYAKQMAIIDARNTIDALNMAIKGNGDGKYSDLIMFYKSVISKIQSK